MSNIVKVEDLGAYLAKVPFEQREIIIASQALPIKDMDKKEFVLEMTNLLLRAVFESGHNKLEEKDQTAILMIACDDLLREFGFLTLEELRIIYRRGVRGQLGEYFGINVKTLYNWVTQYVSESRNEAMKAKMDAMANKMLEMEVKLQPTPEQWNQIMYNSCIELFDKYKKVKVNEESNWMGDIGNIHFKFLNGLELIPKWDIQLVREKVKSKIKKDKDKLSIFTPKKEIDEILKTISHKSEAKKIILEDFFDKLISDNQELRNLLDDKLKN